MFFSIFSIVGINLFKGKYWYCVLPKDDPIVEVKFKNSHMCFDQGGTWVRDAHNFDSFPTALFSIFSIASTAGWAATMYKSADFADVGEVGERHN